MLVEEGTEPQAAYPHELFSFFEGTLEPRGVQVPTELSTSLTSPASPLYTFWDGNCNGKRTVWLLVFQPRHSGREI